MHLVSVSDLKVHSDIDVCVYLTCSARARCCSSPAVCILLRMTSRGVLRVFHSRAAPRSLHLGAGRRRGAGERPATPTPRTPGRTGTRSRELRSCPRSRPPDSQSVGLQSSRSVAPPRSCLSPQCRRAPG